jgi:mannose-6-phosphate isomerase
MARLPLLRFHEHYVPRIWGSEQLRELYGKPLPGGEQIGEAWLISDHASHESAVADGALEGRTLRQLVEDAPKAVLGNHASLTVHGRFPLLLKLLDAADDLSVQVHPDDETAATLCEPDVGKTEMWHVLAAQPGSLLTCGLKPRVSPEDFSRAVGQEKLEPLLQQFSVREGDSVFVPAGTVHAIGKGIVLAEIQQNSDLTYRIYDYGRLQPDGTPRTLHLEKAKAAIDWTASHPGPSTPLWHRRDGVLHRLLAACRYFAAEIVEVSGVFYRDTRQDSFHILLSKGGSLSVSDGHEDLVLKPGEALLVPGAVPEFRVAGAGNLLDYYVPDLQQDVVAPLLEAGHSREAIAGLGADL